MDNTIQLYLDKEKEIKGYPITSPDRVIDENGVNIKEQLDNVANLKEITNTWEAFKNNGGEINGSVIANGDWASIGAKDSSDSNYWYQYVRPSSDSYVFARPGAEQYIMTPTQFSPVWNSGSKILGEEDSPWKDVYVGNYSKDEAGYSKLPNGLMIQWFGVDIEVSPGKDAFKTCTLPISLGVNSFVISKSTELSCRIASGWGYDEYIEYISATSYIQLDGIEKSTVNIKLSDVASRLPETTKFKVKFSLIYYDK